VAIAPNGNLVLSEAGRGGNGSCLPAAAGSVCYGTTGALGLFNFSTNSYSRAITHLTPWRSRTLLCMKMQLA
jgi:hypothetical protein